MEGRPGAGQQWELFALIPRMLLHKSPGQQIIPKKELLRRATMFQAGRWHELLSEVRAAAEASGRARSTEERSPDHELERRAEKANALVRMGELSAARRALEAEPQAEGNDATLRELRDPNRRPQHQHQPLADDTINFQPQAPLGA